ncbi:hypothetical protein MNBD_PLANCTO02-2955 [hydrothermal vent metagenome]|uniref:Uncharacterized protein n=1 Tax=hydrothermal vent metagenome TaxID=652676 RepID=A0A3B1E7L0_9ZZZZ
MDQLFQSMSGTHMILLGGVLLVGMFLFRRTARRLSASRARDPLTEMKRDMMKAEQKQRGSIQELEVRIHNFSRDVEGKIQTRLALLEQQTKQADATIAQLVSIQKSLENGAPIEEIPLKSATILPIDRYAIHLSDAGYSADEVALMIGKPFVKNSSASGYSDAA